MFKELHMYHFIDLPYNYCYCMYFAEREMDEIPKDLSEFMPGKDSHCNFVICS